MIWRRLLKRDEMPVIKPPAKRAALNGWSGTGRSPASGSVCDQAPSPSGSSSAACEGRTSSVPGRLATAMSSGRCQRRQGADRAVTVKAPLPPLHSTPGRLRPDLPPGLRRPLENQHLEHHRSNLFALHVVPMLGTHPIDALSRADVLGLARCRRSDATASGNRALSVSVLVMQHAELLGLRPEGTNPCAGLAQERERRSRPVPHR